MGEAASMQDLLDAQQRYYRRLAPHYRHSGLGDEETATVVERALGELVDRHCRGDVLELACGPGTWTAMLAQRAASVTALDGSPEMLALAAAAVPAAAPESAAVRFVHADIFGWRPDRRYDLVFFGFWLSHVPEALFERFWALVGGCLAPDGTALLVDDAHRTADELVHGADSEVVQRRLRDGSRHRVVKVPWTPEALQRRLGALGWRASLQQRPPFYWGVVSPS